METEKPDDKTLAMLMVIAGMLRHTNGVDHLTTMYERAMKQIRDKQLSGAQATRRV
jgi:hypothetical protein